jgi:tetratricopeptide (TPR) repeat protein
LSDVNRILEAVRAGRSADAWRLAETAVERDAAALPLVLALAAEAAAERGALELAIARLTQALKQSDAPELWRRYGDLLTRADRFGEAMQAFEEALDIDGQDMAARGGAAVAAFRNGQLDAAAAHYGRMLEANPAHVEALTGLAAIAARRGRGADAVDFARRALAQDPAGLSARLALARGLILDAQAGAAIKEVLPISEDDAASPEARVAALDICAEAADALDHPAAAFAHYTRRNQLLASQYAAEAMALPERKLDQARRVGAWLRTCAPPAANTGEATRPHAFLIGFPRSGTTLLEKALGGHPQVSTLEEVDHLSAACGDLIADNAGLARLAALRPDEIAARRAVYWAGVDGGPSPPDRGQLTLDKMPLHTLLLPVIRVVFPDARILFAIRDPRDVVLSCFRRRFGMNAAMYEFLDLQRAADFYDATMDLADLARTRFDVAVHEVRHEAVVDDFDTALAEALGALGLAFDSGVRDFASRAAARARTPSDLQLTGGLSRNGLGTWRRYAAQIASVRDKLDPWAGRFGYLIP